MVRSGSRNERTPGGARLIKANPDGQPRLTPFELEEAEEDDHRGLLACERPSPDQIPPAYFSVTRVHPRRLPPPVSPRPLRC